MGSLRTRLLIGTVAATALLLCGSAALIYVLVRAALYAEFDAALATQTHALTTLVELDGTRLHLEYDAEQLPEYARREHPDYFCFWTADGRVLYRSPSLIGSDLPLPDGDPPRPMVRDLPLPDGRPGRWAGLAFAPRRETGEEEHMGPERPHSVTVVVARDTLAIASELTRLALLLGAVAGVAMLAALAAMSWLVGRLLRPVDQLAGRLAALDADRLHARLGDLHVPAELRPVVARLDDLLVRLEAAFAREKSFTADAAHELRTPLAGLRTTMEVALTRERDAAAYREALTDCLAIGEQMQTLVDNLLSLARLEAGKLVIDRRALELEPFVTACWKPFAAAAAGKQLRVVWTVDAGAQVLVDREKLRLVLGNLFDNAVSYADHGGDLTVAAHLDAGTLRLQVSNSGCSLPAEHVPRVFDRFWRGDAARSATGIHCGLGLALCRKLIELLDGRIGARVADGRFTIEIVVPAST